MWSVRIDDGVATLEENRFGGSKVFPIGEIEVRRFVDLTRIVKGLPRPAGRVDLASLQVLADGSLPGGETQSLAFLDSGRVAESSGKAAFEVLALSSDAPVNLSAGVPYLDLSERPKEKLISWIRLGPGSLAIARTTGGTLLFDPSIPHSFDAAPTPLHQNPVNEIVVSESGERIVATIEKKGRIRSRQIVIHDFSGRLLFESELLPDSFGQLNIHPRGDVLIFDRSKPGTPTETVAMDLASYRSKRVEIIRGTRYYSEDGTRMVVLTPGPGLAHFYDVSDPWNPVKKWTYTADHCVWTAAVSHDGSLIALEILSPAGQRYATQRRVAVLDNAMVEVEFPAGQVESEARGLHWENGYLFRGFQRHPIPMSWWTTEGIQVYDFSDCRARP